MVKELHAPKMFSSTPSTEKVRLQIPLGGPPRSICRHDVQLNCGMDSSLGQGKGQESI